MLKRLFVFWSFIVIANCCVAQGNLVPNPSFEEYDTCPELAPVGYLSRNWFNPLSPSSPDYFNSCAPYQNYGVPKNYAGHEFARTGFAYVGIVTYVDEISNPIKNNWREYLEVQLIDTLRKGVNYCIQFYVSGCDSAIYISNDLGVYFSKNEIRDTCPSNLPCPLPFQPQFENSANNNLNSNSGWTKISGTYLANGGEKYIVIGNFKNSTATIASLSGWTTTYRDTVAYYYVDDVSLTACDSLYNNQGEVNAYLSSEANEIKIEANEETIMQLSVYAISGQLVFQKTNVNQKGKFSLELIPLSTGIYFIVLESEKNKYNFKLFKNN